MTRMTEYEWKDFANFLLSHTVSFVDSELLVEVNDMKEFDLVLTILGKDGSVDRAGRRAISKAFWKLKMERHDFHQQDDIDDKLEARDGMVAGLKERIEFLTTGRDSSELKKKLPAQTHAVTILVEQAVQWKEEVQAATRKVEEAEGKWKAWAEKAQVMAGKPVSAERKKWQAKGKALPVETVMVTTQTDHIQEQKVI